MARLLMVLCSASCVLSTSIHAEWHHYVVDSLAENRLPTLRLRGCAPHLAFYTNAGLEYAFWENGVWVRDTVDIAASYHNGNPALTFDRDGHPHVAWFRDTPWYAYWDGQAWQREEIDPDSGGDFISLVLDSAGRPCVAYSKRRGLLNFMLKFAYRDAAGWHPVLLDSAGGADCVLAIDTLGRFCIAHCQSWSGGALFFVTCTESGWVKETVVPGNTSQCKMVLDENGDPHISYYWAGGGAFDLRYAERVGGIWRFDIVDPGQQLSKRGWDNWIVRDRNGLFHISYHAHNELQVRYARGSLGSWHIEVVNAAGGWNLGSSIDVDDLGRPCMAYVNENQSDRLYVSAQYDLTGVEKVAAPQVSSPEPAATVIRGSLWLTPVSSPGLQTSSLLDISGRKVLDLCPGPNDVSRLAPGVYFIRAEDPDAQGKEPTVGKVTVLSGRTK